MGEKKKITHEGSVLNKLNMTQYMNESSEEGKKNKVGVFCHCKKTRDNRFIKEKVYFGSWFWRFHYMIFCPMVLSL